MKLKVLGMCAIASLLYGENVFADEVQSQENLNGNNTTATQGENSGVSKDINHNINRTNGPSAMNRKNHQRNKKKKANSHSASETLSVGQNLNNGIAANKKLTRSSSSPNFTNFQKSASETLSVGQNLNNGIAGNKKLTRSSSSPDFTNFQKSETAEPTVLDAPNEFPINGSKGSSSFSDSRADTESKEKADAVAQSLSEFKSDSNYKEMANDVNQTLSEFKNDFEDFKLTADSFLNNVLDNPNLSGEQQKNAASFFNDAKISIIKKVDHLNLILNQVSEILENVKVLENLEIDKKIQEVKTYEAEIEKLLSDIQEKRKSQRKQRKQQRQEAVAQKRQKVEQNKRVSVKTGPIDWDAINEYYDNHLSKFASAAKFHKFRRPVVMKYGKECLEDQDGSLFDPGQRMEPSLKGLCTQIYEVRFPEAIKVWSEIKQMNDKDPNYKDKLEELRTKIELLDRNVNSLIRQKTDLYRISRTKDVTDQTRNVNAKEQTKELESKSQSKTDHNLLSKDSIIP